MVGILLLDGVGIRLPLCPAAPDPVPTRSPDVPEGVVGRFTPGTASPVEEPEAAAVAAVFLLAADDEEGVSPLLSTPLLPVLEEAAVCLGEMSDVLDVLEVTRLAFLTGVVGLELRPPCGVLLPDDAGDVPVGV